MYDLSMVLPGDLVVALKDINIDDKHYVGERAAILGSMVGKFPVPQGFIVAYPAYFEFLKHNNLDLKIKHLLGAVNFDLSESISQISSHIRKMIKFSKIPARIVKQVIDSYEKMGSPKVLVQTSVISGDTSQNFFEREYINHGVHGEASLLDVIRSSWASIFTPELMSHRHKNGVNHLKTSVSAFVIKLVQPITSGKILTADPHFNDKSKIIVQISSDLYEHLVDRKNLSIQRRPRAVMDGVHVAVKNAALVLPKLHDYEIIALAKLGAEIEQHFYFPQIIDWAKEKDTISLLNVSRINFYG